MKKLSFITFLIVLSIKSIAQDNKGLEDQLFISITYNGLYKLPDGIKQNSFSGSFNVGYIWDISLNYDTSYSFGLGTGIIYAANAYYHNLGIAMDKNESTTFKKLNSEDYDTNKFSTQYVDILLELRYRKYALDSDNFFRFYLGGKLGFLLNNSSYLNKGKISRVYEEHNIFNNIRFGPTFTIGYGNFIFNIYWGLINLFETTKKFNKEDIVVKEFNTGIIFYIL